MPLFLIITIITILLVFISIFFAVRKMRNGGESQPKKITDVVIFALSLIALIISVMHFRRITMLVSDHNIPMTLIYGNEWGGLVSIGELAVLFALCLITGLRLIKRSN